MHSYARRVANHPPTAEQQDVIALADKRGDLKIEALAGTGKTTTLTMLAERLPGKGVYIAFNKAIVKDAADKFHPRVQCSTAHGLGYRAKAGPYRHRLNGPRRSRREIADILGCTGTKVRLGSGMSFDDRAVAGFAWLAARRFWKSTDLEVSAAHVPRPDGMSDADYEELQDVVLPLAQRAWDDLEDPQGRLEYGHDVYMKMWQLSGPRIAADYIMFDEAQDADAVMLDIVQSQHEAQHIWVGDRFQQIYEWRGAINAMENVAADDTAWLTRSFRFGSTIADEANRFLTKLGAARVTGDPARQSRVGRIDRPRAILTRTNEHAIAHVLDEIDRGGSPTLMGGTKEIIAWANGADALMNGKRSSFPPLACFATWDEALSFVEETPAEELGEMAMLVRLISAFGPRKLIAVLTKCVEEDAATLVVSTAHKAKGCEWDTVLIGADFQDPDEMPAEELRLAYVAVTRARDAVDLSGFGRDSRQLIDKVIGRHQPASTTTRTAAPSRPAPPALRTGPVTKADALAELERRKLPKGGRPPAKHDGAFHSTNADLRRIAGLTGSTTPRRSTTTSRSQPLRAQPQRPAPRASRPAPARRPTPAHAAKKLPWWKRLFG